MPSPTPNPNPIRLDILRVLREDAAISQETAAKQCGLTGRQGRLSVGAWERGDSVPHAKRRPLLMRYLWDHLGLRADPVRFEEVWEMLVEEWGWELISDREWGQLTTVARPIRNDKDSSSEPFQAPATIPHFVARQEELQTACDLLAATDGPAIVAFVGMGGIGKTMLATYAAHRLRNHFANGILWANASLSSPLEFAQSWAQAYGYDFSGISDIESRSAAVRNMLATKHVLIIFDDVLDASTVRPLLTSSQESDQSCRVIITTRNHDVAAALNAHALSTPELTIDAGVDLLVRVLGEARVNAESAAAEQICTLLEGLPLAVEIVAQRLLSRPQQSLGNMVMRLEDVSSRLDTLHVSDRAVRAAFEVSWVLLEENQKKLFALMGLYEGYSFSALALAYICESDLSYTEDILWELQALSLVGHEQSDNYRQHPLLADFAQEKLDEGGTHRVRLAEYYLNFTRHYGKHSAGLNLHWNVIMLGMRVAHQLRQWYTVLDYMEALLEPWFTQGEYSRARQGFTWAYEAATTIKDKAREASCLLGWGRACYEQSALDESKSRLDEAVARAIAINDGSTVADAKHMLAILALEQGEYEDADELTSDCQDYYVDIDDRRGISKAICLQATIMLYTAQYEQARELCTQALAIQEKEEFAVESIQTLQVLINISLAEREHEAAQMYCERALTLSKQHKRIAEIGECTFSLAQVYRRMSNWEKTYSLAEQCKAIFEHTGKRLFYTYALFEQSIATAESGDIAHGIEILQRCLSTLTELNNHYNRIIYLKVLGDFYARLGKLDEAKHYWREGLSGAKSIRHPITNQFSERLANAYT